jgi:hypothetical protein
MWGVTFKQEPLPAELLRMAILSAISLLSLLQDQKHNPDRGFLVINQTKVYVSNIIYKLRFLEFLITTAHPNLF